MLLAASNRQWATAGTVFSRARSRGIIAGKEGGVVGRVEDVTVSADSLSLIQGVLPFRGGVSMMGVTEMRGDGQ